MANIRIPKAKKHPSDEQDRIIIRLPDGLHERLKAAADDTRQTMTQVAVSLMEQGLARYETGTAKEALLDRSAQATLAALNMSIGKALEAKSELQTYFLAQKKAK